jgi:hypothetical protein
MAHQVEPVLKTFLSNTPSICFSFKKEDSANNPVEISSIVIKKQEVIVVNIKLEGGLNSKTPIEDAAKEEEKKKSSPSFNNSYQVIFILPILINIKLNSSGDRAKKTLKKNHLIPFSSIL